MIASAVIAATGSPSQRGQWLPDLASGATPAALGLGGSVRLADGVATGDAGVVLGAGLASLLVMAAGDDLVLVPRGAQGVTVEVPANLDPSRRSARVRLDGVAVGEVLPGARA